MRRLKVDLNIGFENLDISVREAVRTKYLGNYKSVFKGRGLEFESYRAYTQNDDASLVDWKASARSDNLLVKEFSEERHLDVFFLIDVSNTMLLSSVPKLKCEYAAEVVASLCYHIIQSGDHVGYLMFNEGIVHYAPPTHDTASFYNLLDTLSNAEMYGGGYDMTKAVAHVLELLPESSLLFIISDFVGLLSGWEEAVKSALGRFSVIGIMVRDPIDRKIPEGIGQVAIADPYSNDTLLINPKMIKSLYESEVRQQEQTIKSVFLDNGGDFLALETDDDFVESVIELFKRREEKWR